MYFGLPDHDPSSHVGVDHFPLGNVKINFDGASFGNTRLAGYGCVMCNSQGNIIMAKGGLIGQSDANHAELIGLLKGLRILKNKGFYEYRGRGLKVCDQLG